MDSSMKLIKNKTGKSTTCKLVGLGNTTKMLTKVVILGTLFLSLPRTVFNGTLALLLGSC
jgi:hypothetical protein